MLQHITTTITTVILHLYATTGLAGIVLAMALESCLIPLPSEIVMPLAGVIIGSYYTNTSLSSLGVSGHLQMLGTSASLPLAVNLVIVALVGSIGCLIGSIVAYWIGHAGGRPLVLKYGRFLLISQHDTDVADHFFERWGSPTAFFSRLLPVVRTYISLPAGITRMPFGKFCLYTFLGSFPWCLLLAYLGTLIGANLDKLSPYFHDFDIVILVILVALLALYIWRHIRNDRKAREAHAVASAQPAQPVQPPFQQQNGWNQQQQQPLNQPAQTPPQSWGQFSQQQPSQPQQNWGHAAQPQQQTWGQPNPQWSQQQSWGQPPQSPQPPQPPTQQGWGQQNQPGQPPQSPFQQNWGQPVQPGQSGQPLQPPPWSQNGNR